MLRRFSSSVGLRVVPRTRASSKTIKDVPKAPATPNTTTRTGPAHRPNGTYGSFPSSSSTIKPTARGSSTNGAGSANAVNSVRPGADGSSNADFNSNASTGASSALNSNPISVGELKDGKSASLKSNTEVTSNAETSAFTPRLVPDLHNTPTSTSVSDTIDPSETVQSIPDMETADQLNEDWSTSFQGLGSRPFEPRVIDILMGPVVSEDLEITPDGLLYLPEIKYRRILNRAFGPGGWGIAPRTKTLVTKRQVTREYGLICLGRLVSVSRGEQDYFSAEGVTTAMEGCKSNALMRCCKDLGIASELWDPSFIRQFKAKHCDSKYFEKKRRFVWKRKDRNWEYPYNS